MSAPWVGLNECAEHDVGTGGTPSGTMLAFDLVESGVLDYEGGDQEYNVGVGGQVAKYRGMFVPHGTATTKLQTLTLLDTVIPSSVGSLPDVIAEIQGGPVNETDEARKHSDCYITRARIFSDVGSVIKVEYEWYASDEADTTITTAASKQTNTPFAWHNQDVDFNGSGYKCTAWSVELRNNLTPQTSQDYKSSDTRLVEWFDPGNFEVTLTATLRMPLGIDLTADFPSTFTFKVVATNNDGTAKTFTLDLTGGNGLNKNGAPRPLVAAADAVLFEVNATGEPNDLSLVSMSLA